jgi:hypothetical protein
MLIKIANLYSNWKKDILKREDFVEYFGLRYVEEKIFEAKETNQMQKELQKISQFHMDLTPIPDLRTLKETR